MNDPFEFVLSHQLMPLYLSSEYQLYSEQLHSCVLLLLERNARKVEPVLMYLLRHFPCASQKKQLLFLHEINTLVQRFWESVTPRVSQILFQRTAALFSSACAEISEDALRLFRTDGFRQILRHSFIDLAPVLIHRAQKVSDGHWNAESAFLATSLLHSLSHMDALTFSKLNKEFLSSAERRVRRNETWALIEFRVRESNDGMSSLFDSSSRDGPSQSIPRRLTLPLKPKRASLILPHPGRRLSSPGRVASSLA
jgi:hypothetical protein